MGGSPHDRRFHSTRPPPAGAARSGATVAGASALAGPMFGLFARQVQAATRLEAIKSPYGPVAPGADQTTGLPLLQLPEGFTYQSFGWAATRWPTATPTPLAHDGMAVVRARLVDGEGDHADPQPRIRCAPKVGLIDAPPIYDSAPVTNEDATGQLSGGNTTLIYPRWPLDLRRPALGGTLYNCAGGPTALGHLADLRGGQDRLHRAGGHKHGYVFEVPAEPGETSGSRSSRMGRFDHEAVAIDPRTGVVYLTEDDGNQSGLYRFVPGRLAARGRLAGAGRRALDGQGRGRGRRRPARPAIGERTGSSGSPSPIPTSRPEPFAEAPFGEDNTAAGRSCRAATGGAADQPARASGISRRPADLHRRHRAPASRRRGEAPRPASARARSGPTIRPTRP